LLQITIGQPYAEIAHAGRTNVWRNSNFVGDGVALEWGSNSKNWWKHPILKLQMQPFHTKWRPNGENWGKIAIWKSRMRLFRTKWGSNGKNNGLLRFCNITKFSLCTSFFVYTLLCVKTPHCTWKKSCEQELLWVNASVCKSFCVKKIVCKRVCA
jgi:hypothetical protein